MFLLQNTTSSSDPWGSAFGGGCTASDTAGDPFGADPFGSDAFGKPGFGNDPNSVKQRVDVKQPSSKTASSTPKPSAAPSGQNVRSC